MIRNFQSFEKFSLLGQGRKSGEIEFFSEITFDDEIISKGGFANIHRVVSLNGKENRELLIKVYHQNDHAEHAFLTIEKLHLKLQKMHRETGISSFQSYPTLLGLPFLAFMTIDPVDNTSIVGLVMYDLRQLGFLDYGDEQERDEDLADADPIVCSFQLAKTIKFLHDMDFIHSDLKPASIFINPKLNKIALIDFDSGFHYKVQEKPSTTGSLTGWIREFRLFKKQPEVVVGMNKINPEDYFHNEIWALNAAIFQFFSSLHSPYSFLKTLDDKEKEKYIKKIGWPNYQSGYLSFKDSSEIELQKIQELLSALKEAGLDEIVKLFSKSFNEGFFRFDKVGTPREWINSLKNSLLEPDYAPKVLKLRPSKNKIDFANEEVHIEWEEENCDYVSVEGQISKIGQTSIKVIIQDDSIIQVNFHNFYNAVDQAVSIGTNRRHPKIKFFKSDKSIRKNESPIRLKWQVQDTYQVKVNGKQSPFLETGEIEVEPTGPTTYTLECIGGFGEISKAEVFVDVIRPSIDEFSYDINLDHGLDNIDITWKTRDAVSIRIFPIVGEVESEGVAHVPIKGETQFTILAKGLFFSEQKVLKAKPFPIPIIKELMVEFPKIDLKANIKLAPLRIPDPIYQFGKINFLDLNMTKPKEISFPSLDIKLQTISMEQLNIEQYEEKKKSLSIKKLFDRVFKYLKNPPYGKSF
ncbi:MAG: hypothetical protein ACQEW9_18380 [Bacteroidota bacterium]